MTLLLEDLRGFCPWCEQKAAFTLDLHLRYASPIFNYTPDFDAGYESKTRAGVLFYTCQFCDRTVMVLEEQRKETDEPFDVGVVSRRMVYPAEAPRTLPSAAPEGVRGLFEEASTCEKAGAMRAAGVLYRAAVEELVKDQGATGPNLYSKIEDLKGKLADEVVEDFHEARMLGNDSIHAGMTYSADEVADVADLINEAVVVLYVQPAEKRAMRDARKARRQGGGATQTP